ncbi:hybrid sensor histidine kinase/response regulator [Maricaulis sp. CAU 1757]
MDIWVHVDRLTGQDTDRELEAALRGRLAFAFSILLALLALFNASLLHVTGEGRPGMVALTLASGILILLSGIVGLVLRRPGVTMTTIAVLITLTYGLAVLGNRGLVPPAAAYLPSIILGFYHFWGPRSLLWIVPLAIAFFGSVIRLAESYQGTLAYPLTATCLAFAFACLFVVMISSILRSISRHAESRLERGNRELAQALADSRAAQRAKTEFLANVGHEVRTPLNGMLGMADVMDRVGGLPVEQQGRLDLIRQSGATLLQLLDELLDQSKIEVGQLQVEQVDYDLHDLVDRTGAAWISQAEEKGLAFSIDTAGLTERVVRGDPLRTRQVLNNLLSNAIKFTASGGIDIRVSQSAPTPAGTLPTCFEVHDTGVGISADRLDHIFEAFSQADSSITRQYGGTGLGLSISRQLARLMGGDLTASSRPGSGTTFRLALDLAPGVLAPARSSAPARPLRRPRLETVLIVDDVATNHVVLRALLEQVMSDDGPLDIASALSAEEAFEFCRSTRPDLVFMDLQMPVMDGVEAARIMRRDFPPQLMEIVAVSAVSRGEADKLTGIDLFDGYLAKPLRLDALQHFLHELAERQDQQASGALSPPSRRSA